MPTASPHPILENHMIIWKCHLCDHTPYVYRGNLIRHLVAVHRKPTFTLDSDAPGPTAAELAQARCRIDTATHFEAP